MPRALVSLALAGCLLSGCHGPTSPSPTATACNPSSMTARVAIPFFMKPFAGDFPIGNLFDHDKPVVFNDSNGYLLTLCEAGTVPGTPDRRMATMATTGA